MTEEKLDRLLRCLAGKFAQEHGQNTHKLPKKVFNLMERMECCKEAGLNYEYRSSTQDGDVVNVMSSLYVEAVKELAHRGLVDLTDNNLTFVLTNQGFDTGRHELSKDGTWCRIKRWTNEHHGIVALVSLVFTVAGVLIACASMSNA